MTRSTVPSVELIGVDALLHDDTFANVLLTQSTNKTAVETAVAKVATDAGITLSQSQLDDIFDKIKVIDWSKLQNLEYAMGRTDSHGSHPRMG